MINYWILIIIALLLAVDSRRNHQLESPKLLAAASLWIIAHAWMMAEMVG